MFTLFIYRETSNCRLTKRFSLISSPLLTTLTIPPEVLESQLGLYYGFRMYFCQGFFVFFVKKIVGLRQKSLLMNNYNIEDSAVFFE